MKAREIINEALSEWREVQSAADLAHETYDRLTEDEVARLAMRGYTDEIRAALRRKEPTGVPAYANVDQVDEVTGRKVKIYKRTELFDASDYKVAVRSYRRRAKENAVVADALTLQCAERLGVQLSTDEAAA